MWHLQKLSIFSLRLFFSDFDLFRISYEIWKKGNFGYFRFENESDVIHPTQNSSLKSALHASAKLAIGGNEIRNAA